MKLSLFVTGMLFLLSGKHAPTQTSQTICPTSNIPTGWVVTATSDCAGCCGMPGIVHMLVIQKIEGLPQNSVLTICPTRHIPDGWVVTGTQDCAGCCSMPGIVHMPIIKKL